MKTAVDLRLGFSAALAALVVLPLACRAAAPPAPKARDVAVHDAESLFRTTTFTGASFSADGRTLLLSSDATGVFNACAVSVDGGPLRQLTRSTADAVFAVSWFPGDERFLYTADQGGNELNHLYVREADGSSLDLTPGDGVKASFAGWRADDAAFFVLTNEREPRFFDLYRHDVATGYPRELVYQNPGGFDVSDVSRDGRWVALTHIRNNADSNVYVWDAEHPDAAPVHVTPHEGDVAHGVTGFTPDSRELLFTSNAASEFDQVWSHDLESGAQEVLVSADWDVIACYYSRSGRFRVTGVNADARTRIEITDLTSGQPLALPPLPAGDLRQVRFSRDDARVAFYLNGDTQPSNLYTLELASGTLRQLTNALDPSIDPRDLVESEVVRYESFDGLAIPALLYRPHGSSASRPAPALVWVHGGPGGQSRVGYNPTIQHLVNHGYAVLAVNNRGSSGYGKTFFHLDDRRHGEVDLQDCIYGRRYLESLSWVDGKRVGIIGGSYGGYMVAAALAFAPDAFEVGIDIFGVTNWLRTLESIPPWWADFRDSLYAEMGDPATDRERLTRNSPLFHADRIVRPLLVVQGKNDPRVLQVESDELVEAVRKNGVPVEYLLFEDEGHGFRNRKNRVAASEAFLRFCDTYLAGR